MKKKHLLLIGIGAAVATAATFFLLKKRKKEDDERPPKNAPQLPVDNPGDQSEFPKSASASELG